MRIGMVADTYKPHISGITNYISTHKKYLEQQGHEVFVFTFGSDARVDDEENIIRSPGLPLIDTGYYFNFGYTAEAKALLQKMDVIHVHHPFLSGRIALRYSQPVSIPVVFTNHTRYDLYFQAYLPILPDGLGVTFLHAYLPAFCREVDLVISPSSGMKAVLRTLGVDVPIEVIPNGVDLNLFRARPASRKRERFNFSENDVLLIFVGRLASEKNLPFLLRAFAGLRQACPDTKLILVGEGHQKDELVELTKLLGIRDDVHFTGLVPYHQLSEYLAICDVFVTSSITEVHPLSVIEAMAAGLPVLGIESPGVGDIIQNGINGLLSSEDLAAFTAKATLLATDQNLRNKLGKRAQQDAEMYAIERTCQELLSKYEMLIGKAKIRNHGFRHTMRSLGERWRR